MHNRQSNFSDFLRQKQPFQRAASSEPFFEKFDTVFAEMLHSFPPDNRPVYKVIHLTNPNMRSRQVSAAAVCWAIGDQAYVALFFPSNPDTHLAPLEQIPGMLLEIFGANNVRSAFGMDETVPVKIATIIYQPVDVMEVTKAHLVKVIPAMCRRITTIAAVDKVVDCDSPGEVELITMFNADAMRGARIVIEHRFHDLPIADMFDHPIRNDITLMISAQEHRTSHRSMSQANQPAGEVVDLIKVSGYIDFRPSEQKLNRAKPWIEPEKKYLPEFVITDVAYPNGLLSPSFTDHQAVGMAIVAANEFMTKGDWYKFFEGPFLSGGKNDIAYLCPPGKGTPMNIGAVFEHVLDTGYVISVDVPGNPTSDYELGILAEAAQGSYGFEELLRMFAAPMANRRDATSMAPVQFGNIGAYAPDKLQLGTIHNGDSRLPPNDARSIDTIKLIQVVPADQDVVIDRYQQSMLSQGMSSDVEFRAQVAAGVYAEIMYYDTARRVMLNHEAVSWFKEITLRTGLNIQYKSARSKCSGVFQNYINQ